MNTVTHQQYRNVPYPISTSCLVAETQFLFTTSTSVDGLKDLDCIVVAILWLYKDALAV